jgi:hypothetical protein
MCIETRFNVEFLLVSPPIPTAQGGILFLGWLDMWISENNCDNKGSLMNEDTDFLT